MKTEKNRVEKSGDATLIVRRLLNAPQDLVFQAWNTAGHVQQWMKPDPAMTVPSVIMDLRVGGKFRIQMQKPDGEFFTAAGEFREIKAPERVVYTWDWEKDGSGADFGEVEGKTSLVTVEFLKRGQQTELIMTHSRFATVESRDNHATGWNQGVQSFAEFVEKQ